MTHPDIIRYFMTISEAARLVLQAAAIGESGQVLVLDMGEPVRIVDLARDLIRLSGHGQEEIPIIYSGLRPGEKMFEELLSDSDTTLPTRIRRLRIAKLPLQLLSIEEMLGRIGGDSMRRLTDEQVRQRLHGVVPEFKQ